VVRTAAHIARHPTQQALTRRNAMAQHSSRRVVGQISLSLDGRFTGPGGDFDMGWVGAHGLSDGAREILTRMTNSATTVLLGRKNYEGFGGHWPTVAKDETADPRDRAFAQWLDGVEKVVFSTTPIEATWQNSRIADTDPATMVSKLRGQEGGEIVVLNSVSIMLALLQAGELDRLSILLCPELVGGGRRMFPDGLAASSWSLTDTSTTETSAIWLVYDRVHEDR
jgi:dihydrofolate reductase